MAKMIRTFPIIQYSPPSGKLAKSNKPLSTGEEVAQKHSEQDKGSHSLGLAGASRGNISVPPLTGQAGRRRFLSRQTTCVHMGAQAHAPTPGLTPGSRQASFRLAEQEKEAARDHTRGGEGSHLRITLSRRTAQKHMDTSPGSEHTGHYQGRGH